MNPNGTFERDLEWWLQAEAPASAPAGFHAAVIDRARTLRQRPGWAAWLPARWFGRNRNLTLLVAALLLIGGAVAAMGSGLLRLPSVVPPEPAPSLAAVVATPTAVPTTGPTESPSPAPTSTPVVVRPRAASWTPAGDMGMSPVGNVATLLPDGSVLMTDGYSGPCPNTDPGTFCDFVTAMLYDPLAGSWTVAQKLTTPISAATSPGVEPVPLPLPDGGVLMVGCASAAVYDPGTRTLSPALSRPRGRGSCAATVLPNGKVLIAGGMNDAGRAVAAAGLYDPATGSWTATASMGTPRYGPLATLLPDGRVLVVGGGDRYDVWASAELYDPASGTWTSTGSMAAPHGGTATLLQDGRVLVAGGGKNVIDKDGSVVVVASAELYDPASGTWTATGNMITPRAGHSATLLPDGKVLVAGGERSVLKWIGKVVTSADSAELYDPMTGTWTRTASVVTPRLSHTATLLPDGRVLVAGGVGLDASGLDYAVTTAELYDPGSGQ